MGPSRLFCRGGRIIILSLFVEDDVGKRAGSQGQRKCAGRRRPCRIYAPPSQDGAHLPGYHGTIDTLPAWQATSQKRRDTRVLLGGDGGMPVQRLLCCIGIHPSPRHRLVCDSHCLMVSCPAPPPFPVDRRLRDLSVSVGTRCIITTILNQ